MKAPPSSEVFQSTYLLLSCATQLVRGKEEVFVNTTSEVENAE